MTASPHSAVAAFQKKDIMRSTILTSICVVSLLVFSQCSAPKSEQAQVGEAQEQVPIPEVADRYGIDTRQSIITWIGTKPTGQHNGIISLSEGELAITNAEISGGSLTIDIRSLEVMDLKKDSEDYTKLTNHLMSEDFFHADQYPDARFEITGVDRADSSSVFESKEEFKSKYTPAPLSRFMVANPTHRITGNLTMRGVTKSISFPATVSISGETVKVEAKFNIDRTDWGLSYGDEASVADKARDKFIYNTVNVGFSLIAKEQ